MIQGKWFAPGAELSRGVLPVRSAVFGRGTDDLDRESWNVLVWKDEIPAATGRIWWKDGAFRIGDLAVPESLRGQRLGDLVLRLLLFKALDHSAREVRLSCHREVAGFFSRLGFRAESEDSSGIMEMMIPGNEIELDSCKSCPRPNCPNRQSV